MSKKGRNLVQPINFTNAHEDICDLDAGAIKYSHNSGGAYIVQYKM